jgi:hypothetical protein
MMGKLPPFRRLGLPDTRGKRREKRRSPKKMPISKKMQASRKNVDPDKWVAVRSGNGV